MWIVWVNIIVFSYSRVTVRCQLFNCHDDPAFDPDDGPLNALQFTWLGALQYVHMKQGNPHYFRVPRVALISKQFALSTALDAADIPKGYALGNVAFSDYECDEAECGITLQDLEKGVHCDPAILIMPISDVLLHPEYKNFGIKHSVALLKLVISVKSGYMLPACLPYKNFLIDKNGEQTNERIIHVDYPTAVPRDFASEEKEVTRISLLPKEVCVQYNTPEVRQKLGAPGETYLKERMVCTSGCGFHSGAPTIVHEHTGHWTLVALATGGPSCPDPLRSRRPPPPPFHIALYPYVSWITAAITGKSMGAISKDDPFGFIMPRAFSFGTPRRRQGWVGHWWMGGIRCYDRGEAADDLYKFYHEIFQVIPQMETFFTYNLEITAPPATKVVCVKVGMPHMTANPRVWDLNSPTVTLRIPVVKLTHRYRFQVEAWGHNHSDHSKSVDKL